MGAKIFSGLPSKCLSLDLDFSPGEKDDKVEKFDWVSSTNEEIRTNDQNKL